MRHEKTIKRDDGSQVRISVAYDYYRGAVIYHVDVRFKVKHKRKWMNIEETGHGSPNTIYAPYSDYVDDDEILAAKLECWHKMSPNLTKEVK
jgi:hypothetical protein